MTSAGGDAAIAVAVRMKFTYNGSRSFGPLIRACAVSRPQRLSAIFAPRPAVTRMERIRCAALEAELS